MAAILREADGIILDTREHGESDLIVTSYNRDTGRTSAIAKGAKKSKRRFVNKLELFSFLHLLLRQSPGRSLLLLEEAELHSGFISLRTDFARYTAASVIREMILLGTREGEEDEDIYKLILWAFSSLDRGDDHLRVVMCFLLRYFDYIGYRPELDTCMECGVDVDNTNSFSFSIISGGLLCGRCGATTAHTLLPLPLGTIRMLQSVQDVPLERLGRLQSTDNSLFGALKLLHRYGKQVLQRDIISWNSLRATTKEAQEAIKNNGLQGG